MVELVAKYYLYFMIYSFLGWLMEVIYTLFEKKKIVNRGFLIGPYCPIYGWGSLFMILLIGDNNQDFLAVFLKSILVCSVLEYFTSYLMEKLFHARWWDYSDKKFNLNGRICLETMIPFGLLGCLIIYVIQPFISGIVNNLDGLLLIIIAIVIYFIYSVDKYFSFNVILNVKGKIKKESKDNTEEITKNVRKWIHDNSIIYRRINSAFPKFDVRNKK